MSMMKASGDVPQAPADPAPVQTPTITHYQQLAANLAKAIDDVLALIPSFVEAHPDTTIFVSRHQNVPLTFIATAVAAVEANPELHGGTFDATEARDALQFIDAFRPIADRPRAAAKEPHLQHQLPEGKRRHWSVGGLCHRQACRAQSPEHDRGIPCQNLKRDLGRHGGVKKKPQTPAPGIPTPVPAPGTHAPLPVSTIPMESVIGGRTAEQQA